MLDNLPAPKEHSNGRLSNGAPPLELSAHRVSSVSTELSNLESPPPTTASWTNISSRGSTTVESELVDGISQVALAKDEDDDDGGTCGWGPVRPRSLQGFRTARWVLFWLCWAGALQGMVVNGFVNVVITTIERRFDLRSTETGLIAGAYDIASFLCLIPVSYFGGAGKKPRWLGRGVLIMGLGSILFAIPHFTTGKYTFNLEKENLCHLDSNVTHNASLSSICDSKSFTKVSNYKYVFFVAQLLHGAGASPLYTLGVTFLDESVQTKMSSVYVGIFYAMAIIGPALGYLMGGQFLKIYTDFGVEDSSTLGLNPSSNVWVGAWWIGFLLSGIMAFLVALPIMGFPKTLPGAKKIQAEKVSEAHKGSSDEDGGQQMGGGFRTSLRDLPKSLRVLITNPCFMFLSLAGACEALLLAGFAAFLPKYIESQFSLMPSWAALLVGVVTVPAGGGGTFLGGYFVKRFSLRCAGIIKLCILFTFGALLLLFLFVLNCPNIHYAGINVPYPSSSNNNTLPNLKAVCSSECKCSADRYDPICGVNNIMYYSPCYAGCLQLHQEGDRKWYSECTCITGDSVNVTIHGQQVATKATGDMCRSSCHVLPVFLVILFFLILFTFLTSMPALSATLRCVSSSQRSLGLGIQWLIVRLLGSIPAPIVFGALMDSTCILWQDTCGSQGACRAYDNILMSKLMLIVALAGRGVSLLCFFLAWLLYKAPGSSTENGPEGELSAMPGSLRKEAVRVTKVAVILDPDKEPSGYSNTLVANPTLNGFRDPVT